jgi:hypothetical protein
MRRRAPLFSLASPAGRARRRADLRVMSGGAIPCAPMRGLRPPPLAA